MRDFVSLITKISDDYDDKYMKIQLNSDDKLPLDKTMAIPSIVIVFRAVSLENNKSFSFYLFFLEDNKFS